MTGIKGIFDPSFNAIVWAFQDSVNTPTAYIYPLSTPLKRALIQSVNVQYLSTLTQFDSFGAYSCVAYNTGNTFHAKRN